jgi:hypothetical protein
MTLSINWSTKVITVPQADLTSLGGGLYELDVDAFRLALKDIEDGEEGMAFPDTHRHNTAVTLSGVTYARTFEIINGYTVTFQDVGTPYTVVCVGANHNVADVKNVNQVSLIIGNSAGLIQVASGSGLSAGQAEQLEEVHERLGLAAGKPLTQTATEISTDDWTLEVAEPAAGTVTVTRQ